MDEMFPCKQMPVTDKYRAEFDRIFGKDEYDSTKHGDTWNEALKVCAKEFGDMKK